MRGPRIRTKLVRAEERRAGVGRDRHSYTLNHLVWDARQSSRAEAFRHRYNEAMLEEKTSSPNFEASLEELERIVKELEKGDLPLEKSLTLFETGMRLSTDCKKQLEEAETRVELLMKRGSEVVPVPFNPEKPVK
jgi:exodeoxyribonuclease VII small subunit